MEPHHLAEPARPHLERKTRRVAERAAHGHHVRDGVDEQQATCENVRKRVRRQIGEHAWHCAEFAAEAPPVRSRLAPSLLR